MSNCLPLVFCCICISVSVFVPVLMWLPIGVLVPFPTFFLPLFLSFSPPRLLHPQHLSPRPPEFVPRWPRFLAEGFSFIAGSWALSYVLINCDNIFDCFYGIITEFPNSGLLEWVPFDKRGIQFCGKIQNFSITNFENYVAFPLLENFIV